MMMCIAPTAGVQAGGGEASAAALPPPATAANTSLPGDPDDPLQYPVWNVRRYRPYFDVDTKVCMAVA
jgi:hypothetical protein